MNNTTESKPTLPLRWWPALVILLIQGICLGITVTPEIQNFTRFVVMMAGPLVCLLFYLIWWYFGSRLSGLTYWLVPIIALITAAVTNFLVLEKVGLSLWIYGIPMCMLLVTVTLWITRNWTDSARWEFTALASSLAWVGFLLLQHDGIDGAYIPTYIWRWQPTVEQLLTVTKANAQSVAKDLPAVTTIAATDWPHFRGPARNSSVTGATISLNWQATPPKILWSIPCGPGWSSLAIVGNRLFTQEQLGDDETVVSYDATTGQELWRHRDAMRFDEVVAGPGPRATPTFSNGKLYTFGSRGLLSCFDATSGNVLWQHPLEKEVGVKIPMWGCSSSPLVINNQVIIYANGNDDNGLMAFDAETGKLQWKLAVAGDNYASVEPMILDNQPLLLFGSQKELLAIDQATQKIVWQWAYTGSASGIATMVQPQRVNDQSFIMPMGDGFATARLQVKKSNDQWQVEPTWNTKNLKPSFNDFVQHNGYLYGFDQSIVTCIDAQTGERQWKKGRYGFGQLLLFADQGLILVLGEYGELTLLAADPKQHRELGKFQALDGKTWNHPAWANGRLYVRNGKQIVCLDLGTVK